MTMNWSQVKTFRAGTTNLVAALSEEIEFEQIVNRSVTWDPQQCVLSPGTLAKALIINILDDRRALWRVDEYFEHRDTEALLGKGVIAAQLNDDALGRMLDRVAAAGPKELFMQVVLSAIKTHHLDLTQVHTDTTSWSVSGAYKGAGRLNVTYGHSKDRAPDLKQILFGLGVNRDGVPIMGQVMGGNTSDKTWNQEAIAELKKLLSPEQLREIIYVADSAMVTQTNLSLLAKQNMQFISRLPANFGLLAELKQVAWEQDTWTPIGTLAQKEKGAAQYKVQEFIRELYGRTYRFIVVHSTHLDARKQKTLERQLKREHADLEKAVDALQEKTYECKADAEGGAREFVEANQGKFHPVQTTIQEVKQTKRRRGRPRKDEEPQVQTYYRIKVQILKPEDAHLAEWLARASTFVLISNLDGQTYTPKDVLREYKEQTAVETRFRFLKDPFFADQLYLKNKERLEALAYLLLIAVLIATLLERRVRLALALQKAELVVPGGVKRARPTIQGLLDMFEAVLVLAEQTPEELERYLPALPPQVRSALHLAGFSEAIYTRPYPPRKVG